MGASTGSATTWRCPSPQAPSTFPPGHDHDHPVRFATVEEEIAGLALDPSEGWAVEVAEEYPRPATTEDGTSYMRTDYMRTDTIVRLRRG